MDCRLTLDTIQDTILLGMDVFSAGFPVAYLYYMRLKKILWSFYSRMALHLSSLRITAVCYLHHLCLVGYVVLLELSTEKIIIGYSRQTWIHGGERIEVNYLPSLTKQSLKNIKLQHPKNFWYCRYLSQEAISSLPKRLLIRPCIQNCVGIPISLIFHCFWIPQPKFIS